MRREIKLAALILVSHAILAHAGTVAGDLHSLPRYQHVHRPNAPMNARHHRMNAVANENRLEPQGGLVQSLSASTTNFGFLTGSTLSPGGLSFSPPVAGDFNGDGLKDVAAIVSNDYGGTFSLSVMPGNGDGTFGAPVITPCSFDVGDLLYVADVNDDGEDDIVLVHSGNFTGSYDVFLSTGGGTFAAPATYVESAANPAAVAIADVNGDGKLDIIVADGLPVPDLGNPAPSVSTFLGNGDGTFNSPTQVAYPGPIASGVFADVNGDGKLDLISNSQVILASLTGGYLAPTSLVSPGQTCVAFDGVLAVGDLDGDGFPDIATADCQNDTVTVYLDNGHGGFLPGISYWAGYYPQSLAIADVNNDGIADIIVTNADSGDASILLGNGNGTLRTPAVGFALGGLAYDKPVLADFNQDAKMDLVSASYVPDISLTLIYFEGFGDGTFSAARDYYSPQPSAGQYAYGVGVASGDFNGDGKPDFVLGNSGSNNIGITVFLGNATGLQSGTNYGSGGNLNFVGTGDFNGDGKEDIVASDDATGKISVFFGNGDGTFQAPVSYGAGAGPAQGLVVGDFNGDGKPDVAVTAAPNAVVILINNGLGGFNSPTSYFMADQGWEIAAADLNNDGIIDLVIPQAESHFASILLGNGDGTFTAKPDFDLGNSFPAGVALGDWNGDGKNDIAVTIDDDTTRMGVAIALGNGDGTFQTATLYPVTSNVTGYPYPAEIHGVDLDHDGNLDLVYVNSQFGTVGVLYGTGSGTFGSPNEFPGGVYSYGLVTADANGDGGVDAIIADDSSPTLAVLLNVSGSSMVLSSSFNPAVTGQSVTFTATVTAGARGVRFIPGGTVIFYDGGASLGQVALNGGQAALSTSSLSTGNHSITASYSGDASFFSNTSAPLVEVINSTGAVPGYQVGANPASATIQQGQSAQFAVMVSPTNGFQGTVSLSCDAPPPGVSCQFNPGTLTVNGGSIQSILTVNTANRKIAERSNRGNLIPLWASCLLGLMLVGRINRRQCLLIILSVVTIVALCSLTGCAGSTRASVASPVPQVLRVTATSTSEGKVSQQIGISITIVD